jgi:hypothetical protein
MSKKNDTPQYVPNTQEEQNSVSIKLLSQSFEYMKTALDDIKKSIVELQHEVKNGFVSKEEFMNLKKEVQELQDLKGWALRVIIGSVIMGLLALLWSQK